VELQQAIEQNRDYICGEILAVKLVFEALHGVEGIEVEIGDDGRGGARPDAGTGMLGVMRRLAAFDGTMSVSSPVGGPTVVTHEFFASLAMAPRWRRTMPIFPAVVDGLQNHVRTPRFRLTLRLGNLFNSRLLRALCIFWRN
jgi:hypothetical protein